MHVALQLDPARRPDLNRKPTMDLWYDTDPGFDDWMAWALLEAEPRFRLHGVSVVAGNAPLSITLPNALAIKALHGFKTPVFAGCDRPLAQAQTTAQDVLGAMGMETTGPVLPPAPAGMQPSRRATVCRPSSTACAPTPAASRCWRWGR